jgi:septum formation protein
MSKLILASGSAVRARLLQAAGVPFALCRAAVDEVRLRAAIPDAAPPEVALTLAAAKAADVAAQTPAALVLGADQVLVFEGEIVGKSPDRATARTLLKRMAGKTHTLVSGLVLRQGQTELWRHVETATLTMRPLSEAFLDAYLAAEGDEILYSVGCYRLEGMGIQLFQRIEGDYFAILGLPLLPLMAALREHGVIS